MAVLEVALRDVFHPSDVSLLDERIQQHHRLFLKARPAPHRLQCHPRVTLCVTLCVTNLNDTLTVFTLFDAVRSQVNEYNGLWKPKHHFETHLPVDLLRFGPLRGYWCMSFEGFNKIVKQATEISNYRSEDMFVLEHWMMKSAKVLRRLRDSALCIL